MLVWLILCCLGFLIPGKWTDEQTDICTSRVAFATEKESKKAPVNLIANFLNINQYISKYQHCLINDKSSKQAEKA